MPDLRIEIDGEPLDLLAGVDGVFYVTRQIYDLSNLNTRNADYTKQIEVPGTAKNKRLLEGAGDVFSIADKAAVVPVIASILIDGVPIANNAQIFVDEVNDDDTASITLFYGNFNFFDKISGNIADLDLTDQSFTWDIDTIDTTLKDKTEHVVFLLSDWLNIFETAQQPADAPIKKKQDILVAGYWYYCYSLIERIVNDAGFTLDTTDILDPLYTELVISCPLPVFVLQESDSVIGEQKKLFDQLVGNGVTERIEFDQEISAGTDVTWSTVNDEFTWTGGVDIVVINSILRVVNTTSGINESATVRLWQNAVIIASNVYTAGSGSLSTDFAVEVTASPGDVFFIDVICTIQGSNGGELEVLALPLIRESFFLIFSKGSTPDRIINNPATFLPDMTKRDFMMGIFSMMNIVMQTDDLEKIVKLEQFKNIDENPEQTPIIDVRSETTQTTLLDSYFRNNIFQYSEESNTERVRSDTDDIFLFDDARLNVEGIIIDLPFKACDNSLLYQELFARNPVANSSAYETEIETITGVSWTGGTSAFARTEGVDLRIGQYIGFTGVLGSDQQVRRIISLSGFVGEIAGEWTASQLDTSQTLVITVSYSGNKAKIARAIPSQADYWLCDGFVTNVIEPPPDTAERIGVLISGGFEAVFDSPMLWDTLLTNNYFDLLESLKRPLILNTNAILTPLEFTEFNFLRPVYLGNPYNALFYCNKIDQWKVNSPTRMTLIRI